jgi:hypothetical protein
MRHPGFLGSDSATREFPRIGRFLLKAVYCGHSNFSSGEATTLSNHPEFGLRQHTIDEGVVIQTPFVDFDW